MREDRQDGGSFAARHWCEKEFEMIDLGDERLNARFLKTVREFANRPEGAISQACVTKASVKGAYRLLANEKVDRSLIIEAHAQVTAKRAADYGLVFLLQDTSYLEFGGHKKTKGLGPIAAEHLAHLQGFVMHSCLCVGSDGVSLGLLYHETWARGQASRSRVLGDEKESAKWSKALERSVGRLKPGTKAVTIADREADVNEFIQTAVNGNHPFLIRLKSKRREVSGPHITGYVSEQEATFCYEIDVAIKTSKNASKRLGIRRAKVSVRYAPVRINKVDAPFYVIFVTEDAPVEGSEPVAWILFTNEVVTTTESALEKIDWYKQRWHIENFHRVLKSGCTIEESRLAEADKLERYIAMMSVIAWKLYWMNHLGRADPKAACTIILSEPEWHALYCTANNTIKLPDETPTTQQALYWIGRLGGFLGRLGKEHPGVITLWRGYQRLQDLTEMWRLLRSAATSG